MNSSNNKNNRIEKIIAAINKDFSVDIIESGFIHLAPFDNDGKGEKTGVKIENSAEVFQAVKEYIKNHPTEFKVEHFDNYRDKGEK